MARGPRIKHASAIIPRVRPGCLQRFAAAARPRALPCLLAGAVWAGACGAGSSPPAIVAPAPALTLDPAVKALLDEQLALARAHPEQATSHGALGLAYAANGLWSEAARCFDGAARLDPADGLWIYYGAIAHGALGESDVELERLERARDALPDEPYALHRLGQALLSRGRAADALPYFARTVELAPDRAEGHTGVGAAQLALGAPERATAALERAVALDPAYKTPHYLLGLAYRELGRNEDAERELAQGLEGHVRFLSDPHSPTLRQLARTSIARLQQALGLLDSGKTERALRLLEGLREEHPDDVTVLNDLAVALQRLGRLDEAFRHLEEARRLDPDVLSTWINLASLCLDQGMTARALEHADHAVELEPTQAKAHVMRARVLLRQGRREDARAALDQAAGLDPRSADALALLAGICLELDDLEGARRHYGALARLQPFDPTGRAGLGEVALRLGSRDEAARELAAAQALAPHHPAVDALARRLENP